MTFLSIFTPTYQRPQMLAMCQASVQAQTVPVEHVVIRDEVGLGIGGMYGDIRHHTGKVHGDYVMVLSDDNVLVWTEFAAEFERRVRPFVIRPDVVVFKGETGATVQPAAWGGEPVETKIDLSCFAVRRDVWVRHADAWGERYEGDFDFIHSLWERGYTFVWWDVLVFRALRISQGQPETA